MRNKLELICVSLGALTHKQALTACAILPFVEIRIDLLKERKKLPELLRTKSRKIITFRKSKDISDKERFLILEACIGKSDYIDIEHDAPKKFKNDIFKKIHRSRKTKIISSFHDFKRTPDRKKLLHFINESKKQKSDYVKIATEVKSFKDSRTLISLLDEDKNLIVLGMGDGGKALRLFSPFLGSLWTYGAYSHDAMTAPGQIHFKDILKCWEGNE